MKCFNILLILLFTVNVVADCNKPVTYVTEGAPAPCNGYHITVEQEAKFYRINEENKLRKDLDTLKNKQLDLYRTEVNLLRDDRSELQKKLMQERKFETLKNTGYFMLGVVITGIIAKGLVESIK